MCGAVREEPICLLNSTTEMSSMESGHTGNFFLTRTMRMSLPVERRQSCFFVSGGCSSHVAWHFYENDWRPVSTGEYDNFSVRVPCMLSCAMDTLSSACVPNGPTRQYLADQAPPRPSSSSWRTSWTWWRLRPHRTVDRWLVRFRGSTKTWMVAPATCVSSTRMVRGS